MQCNTHRTCSRFSVKTIQLYSVKFLFYRCRGFTIAPKASKCDIQPINMPLREYTRAIFYNFFCGTDRTVDEKAHCYSVQKYGLMAPIKSSEFGIYDVNLPLQDKYPLNDFYEIWHEKRSMGPFHHAKFHRYMNKNCGFKAPIPQNIKNWNFRINFLLREKSLERFLQNTARSSEPTSALVCQISPLSVQKFGLTVPKIGNFFV